MWKNTVQSDRPQMTTWRRRIVCWIRKATDTHSEYVTLTFHRNSSCTNARQCYAIRGLPVLLNLTTTSVSYSIGLRDRRKMSEARVWIIGGMVLTDETRNNRTKPVPSQLCLPEIQHGLTSDRIRAAAVRYRQLTACATAVRHRQLTASAAVVRYRQLIASATAARHRQLTASPTVVRYRQLTASATEARHRQLTASATVVRYRKLTASATAARHRQLTASATVVRYRQLTASATAVS